MLAGLTTRTLVMLPPIMSKIRSSCPLLFVLAIFVRYSLISLERNIAPVFRGVPAQQHEAVER